MLAKIKVILYHLGGHLVIEVDGKNHKVKNLLVSWGESRR